VKRAISFCPPEVLAYTRAIRMIFLSRTKPLVDLADLSKFLTRLVADYRFTAPLLTFAIAGRPLGFSLPGLAKDF